MSEQEVFETYEILSFEGDVIGDLENIFSGIGLDSIEGGFGSDEVRVECQTLEGRTKVSVSANSRDNASIAIGALTKYIENQYNPKGLVIVNKRFSGTYQTPN